MVKATVSSLLSVKEYVKELTEWGKLTSYTQKNIHTKPHTSPSQDLPQKVEQCCFMCTKRMVVS